MKHLRLFESFQSYRKIELSDTVTILHNNYLSLNSEDFSHLSKKIQDRYPEWNFRNNSSFVSDGESDGLIFYNNTSTRGFFVEYLQITFLRDEWFLVEIRNRNITLNYECDQTEGLYELLDKLYPNKLHPNLN